MFFLVVLRCFLCGIWVWDCYISGFSVFWQYLAISLVVFGRSILDW